MIHCATVFHSCLCSFPSNVFQLKINALFDVAFRFNIGNASHSTRSRGCVATAALYCGQIQENRFRKVKGLSSYEIQSRADLLEISWS